MKDCGELIFLSIKCLSGLAREGTLIRIDCCNQLHQIASAKRWRSRSILGVSTVSTWNWKSTCMHTFPTFTPPSSQCLRNTALQCGIWVSWDEFTPSPSNVFWDVRTWNVCQRRWNSMSNYFFRWSRVTSLYFIQNIKNQGKKFRAFIVLIRSSFFSCLLSQVAGKKENEKFRIFYGPGRHEVNVISSLQTQSVKGVTQSIPWLCSDSSVFWLLATLKSIDES